MIRNLFLAVPALLLAACASTPTSPSVKPERTEAEAAEPAPVAELSTTPGPGQRMPSGRDLGVRSAVVAPHAAAATAHPLATQVALDVMKRGGSAMDGAIAANAMLGLVEPTANGIGGDLFAIVWDPESGQLYGYNGSGRSPMGATLEDIQAKADEFMDGEEIPPFGAAPVTVPGTVDAWGALHERFGKLPFNTDGGGLCNNHPMFRGGITKVIEAVRQLRGEAHPAVQVPNCDLAVATGIGGSLGARHGAATVILERQS